MYEEQKDDAEVPAFSKALRTLSDVQAALLNS